MWKDYSISYIKKNKATGISIMAAALIASLFISMLCTLFYNMWQDDITRLIEKEDDWHVKINADLTQAELESIKSYAGVRDAVQSNGQVSVYFDSMSRVYDDMPVIAEKLGIAEEFITYHNLLLSRYFVFSPEEKQDPPLLLAFYVSIVILLCFSLVLIIRNAFQFSMETRLHQLGILKSIGATPKQLRSVLTQEALLLSAVPIFIGNLAGIGLCYGFFKLANSITAQLNISGTRFRYHAFLFLITLLASLATLFFSAWFPARKLGRITPLSAIRGNLESPVEKVKKFRVVSSLFGIEGELARKSLYVRRKAFRTATVSLTVSFLVISVFLNFITLSELSTKHTYFERYQDAWDVMITLKETEDALSSSELGALRRIDGVSSLTAYQKATAFVKVDADAFSNEVQSAGGYGKLNIASAAQDNSFVVEAPLFIFDDESFQTFAAEAGVPASENKKTAAITLNNIWDSVNSSFKDKAYIPFLETNQTLRLYSDKDASKALGTVESLLTTTAPVLREEFKNYSLVQIISASSYQTLSSEAAEWFVNIRCTDDNQIQSVAAAAESLLEGREYSIENRPDSQQANAKMYQGYRTIMLLLCSLLAFIGIANVFANTMGYVFQRRREFARYASVGLTPRGITKMLGMEALVIAIKPILLSIPFNVLFVLFAVNQSGIAMGEFVGNMPIVPLLVFSAVVIAAVFFSYSIGGRTLKKNNILEALKDDTLH